MAKHFRWLALALVVLTASTVFLARHLRVRAQQPATQYINLSWNGGSCQQNGSNSPVDVFQNAPIVYQGVSSLSQFQVQFSTCPLAACPVSSPSGAAVNVGNPTKGPGVYNYSSMTINNQQCSGVGSMGLRIKSGP